MAPTTYPTVRPTPSPRPNLSERRRRRLPSGMCDSTLRFERGERGERGERTFSLSKQENTHENTLKSQVEINVLSPRYVRRLRLLVQ